MRHRSAGVIQTAWQEINLLHLRHEVTQLGSRQPLTRPCILDLEAVLEHTDEEAVTSIIKRAKRLSGFRNKEVTPTIIRQATCPARICLQNQVAVLLYLLYPVHVRIRKSFGEMTRKLSDTASQ
jgi:hypothetical protein